MTYTENSAIALPAQTSRETDGREGRLEVVFLFPRDGFFDFHIAILVGVENLATIQALNILGVFFTRYDTDFGMFAGGIHEELGVRLVLLG
jgi:hypothetical protein